MGQADQYRRLAGRVPDATKRRKAGGDFSVGPSSQSVVKLALMSGFRPLVDASTYELSKRTPMNEAIQ